MKRLVTSLVLAVALLVSAVAGAITDIGSSAMTRLYAQGDDGERADRFACSASYIQPRINESRAWIVSAGHCFEAIYARRNHETNILGAVNWQVVIQSHDATVTGKTIDIALGTVPDVRQTGKELLFLADKAPDRGRVYIHGFPAGIERVSEGIVVPEAMNDRATFRLVVDPWGGSVQWSVAEQWPGTRILLVNAGEVGPGSSGSPILGEDGRLVGILWGGLTKSDGLVLPRDQQNKYDVILWTPVEQLRRLMDTIEVK